MGKKSSIVRNRYRQEIEDCLQSRWSPRHIEQWLKASYGPADDIPSYRAIYRYRKKYLSTAKTVPTSLIQKRLGQVHYKVDLMGIYSRVIWALDQRMGLLWEKEQAGGPAVSELDRTARTLLEALREYRQLAQDLGVIASGPHQQTLNVETHRTQAIVLSREELEDLKAAAMLAAGRGASGNRDDKGGSEHAGVG